MGVSGQAYIKTLAGKDYIILKGRPGLRPTGYQGTRYLATNPRVNYMTMGIKNMARSSARVSIVAIFAFVAIDIARTLTGELNTGGKFIGTLGMDICKCLVAGAAGWATAAGAVGLGIVAGVAAPLIIALVVGTAIGLALDYIWDSDGQVTTRVCNAIDQYLYRQRQPALNVVSGIINDGIRAAASWAIMELRRAALRELQRYLSPISPGRIFRLF